MDLNISREAFLLQKRREKMMVRKVIENIWNWLSNAIKLPQYPGL